MKEAKGWEPVEESEQAVVAPELARVQAVVVWAVAATDRRRARLS